jgi:hypothetical protein
MASSGKTVEIMFESVLDTYEKQDQLIDKTTFMEPDPAKSQNSGNVVWRPTQQHAPVISGWDLTGQETGIIEETYPSILGTPSNDFVQQRADDLRDPQFWKRRGEQSGMRQASELNKAIANAIAIQGSKFIRSNTGSGYSFIAEAQALLNETQQYQSERCFVLNDRDTLTYSSELAGRQTLQGRPESDAWSKGQIGANVAGFNVYTGSYLPNLVGGAAISTTVTGTQSLAPEEGTVDQATGIVTNVDYRSATIPVAASASYNVGDKVEFHNTAVAVQSIGLSDKNSTGQPMTFTIVAKPTATSITVYPKPIALDDGSLTTLERAYANVNTRILNGATVERVNTDATNKTNLFFDKSAIEVVGGTIPAELFKQYDGMKVVSSKMANGLTLYMVYDGNIATMNFRYRIFTWYGITVANPQNCGVAVSY